MKGILISLTALMALLIMASPAAADTTDLLSVDLSKEAEGADLRTFPSGSDVPFQITLFNNGTLPIDQIVVVDPLTTDCERTLNPSTQPSDFPLAVGATYSYSCTAAGVTAGFTNVATATATRFTPPFAEDPYMDTDSSTVEISTPPQGDEGCTPGYWKQEQHFDSWDGLSQSDLFADVFGRLIDVRAGGKSTISDPTLLEALNANGGGINALARHGVAALLNATSPDVTFAYTSAEVIQMVQSAIDGSTDLEAAKDKLAEANEAGCTLN